MVSMFFFPIISCIVVVCLIDLLFRPLLVKCAAWKSQHVLIAEILLIRFLWLACPQLRSYKMHSFLILYSKCACDTLDKLLLLFELFQIFNQSALDKHNFDYRKVASTNASRLEAHFGFYRLVMKRKNYVYLL